MNLIKYTHSSSDWNNLKKVLTQRCTEDDVFLFKNLYQYIRLHSKLPTQRGKIEFVFYYSKKYEHFYEQILNVLKKCKDPKWTELKNSSHIGWVHPEYNITIRSTGNADGLPIQPANRNAYGKQLADAAERATCVSLFKKIKSAKDTGQTFFIQHPEAFADWKKTFEDTGPLLEKKLKLKFDCEHEVALIGVNAENLYECVHLGKADQDYEGLVQNLKIIAKAVGFRNLNSWCPADILIVEKRYKHRILCAFQRFVDHIKNSKNGSPDIISLYANILVWNFAKNKRMFPVSLKQIKDDAKFEEHIPSQIKNKGFVTIISKVKMRCNMNLDDTMEIGEMSFTDLILNPQENPKLNIKLQVRGKPKGYSCSQFEYTSDGSVSGGRVGVCPKNLLIKIFEKYKRVDDEYIWFTDFGNKSAKSPIYFFKWNNEEIIEKNVNKIMSMYDFVTGFNHSAVIIDNPYRLTKQNLQDALRKAQKGDLTLATRLCHKIQGLSLQCFLLQHYSEISEIVSDMVTAAKKITKENCYFVKVY